MPNQDNQTNNSVSTISPQSDLPPMPPAFQDLPQSKASGANSPPVITSNPKKKFGGGRIIATLLGILLLVGGVGAGLILTQQQQLFQQRAAANCCKVGSTKSCTIGGQAGTAHCVTTDPTDCEGQSDKGRWASCQVNNPPPGSCTPNCTGKACGSGKDGCGHTCENGSGCNYCKPATQTFCQNNGSTCEPDSNGGHCSTPPGQTPRPTAGPGCDNSKSKECGNNCILCGMSVSQCTCLSGYSCSANYTCIGSGLVRQYDPTKPSECGNNCIYSGKTAAQCTCSNGYTCTSNFTCQANPNTTSCGRNLDQNAPVCCNVGQKCNGQTVCEPPHRLECLENGKYCTIDANGCNPTSPGPNPTPNPAASCQAIKAYNTSWTALTTTQLSALKTGAQVNFCVTGATTTGSFDKAQFTINGTQQPETTTKGQGAASAAFCQKYTLPAGTSTFKITAQMHHKTLGWVQ